MKKGSLEKIQHGLEKPFVRRLRTLKNIIISINWSAIKIRVELTIHYLVKSSANVVMNVSKF